MNIINEWFFCNIFISIFIYLKKKYTWHYIRIISATYKTHLSLTNVVKTYIYTHTHPSSHTY